jgi:dihydroorotate dehydrogenase
LETTALELGLDGIIATNTTIARDHLATDPAGIEAAGAGRKGVRARSLVVIAVSLYL